MVTIYHFTPNRVGEWFYIAVGRVARGKAAFTILTHPQTPALAGASVGTRKVLRLWITVGVNLYIIAKINKKVPLAAKVLFYKRGAVAYLSCWGILRPAFVE